MALRSDDKFIVVKTTGGNKPEEVPLSEFNTFVSAEEAPEIATLQAQVGSYDPATTGRTITEDLNTAYTPIMKQGVRAKMDKMSTGDDDMPELLENKHLIEPLINDTDAAAASYTLTLTPEDGATGSITITVRKPGADGNSYEMKDGIMFNYTGTVIEIATQGPGQPLSGQDFLDWYNAGEEFGAPELQADMLVSYTGDMTLKLPMISTDIEFTGGVDGHALLASAAEIDDTVDAVASYTPTGTDLGTDVGTLWTDVETASTGLLDRTTALETTVDTATTGLVDRMAAAEGDIDDLEAMSPVSGAPTLPVTAKLTTGVDNSEIDWEADTAGVAGNSISLTFEVPATSLSVATNTAASEIILTAAKGVHPVSITLLGGESQSLAVTATGSDITVQLATDGSSVVTSTAATVLAAIVAAMATGQPLDGIITSAVGGASYDGDTLMLAQAIDYFDATDGVSVDVSTPTDIIVSVDYDGATDLPTSTANEVLTAVNLASELVTGTAGGAGTDTVAEMAADNLTGGVDGTPGSAGAIRYETGKLWISTDISTTAVSHWEYATLT